MAWVAGALFTNPAAGTVLVDTGALVQRWYRFCVFLTGNTGQEMVLEYRNGTNTATLASKIVPVVMAVTIVPEFQLNMLANERIRVTARADVTGEAEVSIFYESPEIHGFQSHST